MRQRSPQASAKPDTHLGTRHQQDDDQQQEAGNQVGQKTKVRTSRVRGPRREKEAWLL